MLNLNSMENISLLTGYRFLDYHIHLYYMYFDSFLHDIPKLQSYRLSLSHFQGRNHFLRSKGNLSLPHT